MWFWIPIVKQNLVRKFCPLCKIGIFFQSKDAFFYFCQLSIGFSPIKGLQYLQKKYNTVNRLKRHKQWWPINTFTYGSIFLFIAYISREKSGKNASAKYSVSSDFGQPCFFSFTAKICPRSFIIFFTLFNLSGIYCRTSLVPLSYRFLFDYQS